jgi:hypothetical protein
MLNCQSLQAIVTAFDGPILASWNGQSKQQTVARGSPAWERKARTAIGTQPKIILRIEHNG